MLKLYGKLDEKLVNCNKYRVGFSVVVLFGNIIHPFIFLATFLVTDYEEARAYPTGQRAKSSIPCTGC